jgi:hypothetical protein
VAGTGAPIRMALKGYGRFGGDLLSLLDIHSLEQPVDRERLGRKLRFIAALPSFRQFIDKPL